jgi:hypothetical protein
MKCNSAAVFTYMYFYITRKFGNKYLKILRQCIERCVCPSLIFHCFQDKRRRAEKRERICKEKGGD